MLVVKILPAKNNSFTGVAYNEEKIDKEKSNLLSANNFIGLDKTARKSDYITYFKNHSAKNKRMKLPQFHASVSARGREKSFEELKTFGEHYMEQMGYGNNPYLIYKHNDTKNNHIHIVSSRVDSDGKKIADNYERVRSQKIINRYFGIDIQKEVEKKLKMIDKYNFKSIAQYKLLLEKTFNKVIEKKEEIAIHKSEKKFNLKKSEINTKINKNKKLKVSEKETNRKTELKLYLLELSKTYNLDEIKLIAEKENIDLVVFMTKDKSKNFGYTVIDKDNKMIFKGSKIIPLKTLETNKEIIQEAQKFEKLLNDIKTERQSLENLNLELARIDRNIDKYGNVYKTTPKNNIEPKKLFSIDRTNMSSFNYHSTANMISEKYSPMNEKDKKILAFVFRIKKDDIELHRASDENERKNIVQKRNEISSYYNYSINYLMDKNYIAKDLLKENSIELFKLDSEFYIIDKENKYIGAIELTKEVKEKIEQNKAYTTLSQNEQFERTTTQSYNLASILNELSSAFSFSGEEGITNTKGKKSKKRKQRNHTVSR